MLEDTLKTKYGLNFHSRLSQGAGNPFSLKQGNIKYFLSKKKEKIQKMLKVIALALAEGISLTRKTVECV